jgi:hypothetical protein
MSSDAYKRLHTCLSDWFTWAVAGSVRRGALDRR